MGYCMYHVESVIAFMKQLYYVYTSTFLWASMGQPSLFDSVNWTKPGQHGLYSRASTVQFSTVWLTTVV